jgi:hypothetical protein
MDPDRPTDSQEEKKIPFTKVEARVLEALG